MALFGWLTSRQSEGDKRRALWRDAWNKAIEAEDAAQLPVLREQLNSIRSDGDDVEIEDEMLDAAEQWQALAAASAGGTLPPIETHHRVVGTDVCYFSAPASLPGDPAQPSGRVLMTNARSLFLGGARGSTIAWHSVREVLRLERDVLLVRGDGTPAVQFRFNSYGDAVVAAFLARRLKNTRSTRGL